MRLTGLIYTSERIDKSDECIENIMHVALASNSMNNITGMLLFTDSMFAQYIEGDYNVLMSLYQKILVDKRHANIKLLELITIKERLFPNWSMARRSLEVGNDYLTNLSVEERNEYNQVLFSTSDYSFYRLEIIKKVLSESIKPKYYTQMKSDHNSSGFN